MLPDILEMLLDIPDRISGKVCSGTVPTTVPLWLKEVNNT
jgi:hypothetical protein